MIDWFTFHRDFWKLTYVLIMKDVFFNVEIFYYLYRLKYKKIMSLDQKNVIRTLKEFIMYIIYKVNIIINNEQT